MSTQDQFNQSSEAEADVKTLPADPKTAQPPLYALIMHNDDYTTMEFVMMVLMSELFLSPELAYRLMMTIHETGMAKVAVLPKEIAEMKALCITQLAEAADYPLLITVRPE